MARPATSDPTKVFTIALVAFTVAVLYFAREVLIPFALAVLLSFLLAPLVTKLERWKLGRVPSVVIVVFSLFLVVGAFGWMVTDQLVTLGNNFDTYRGRIETRIKDVAPGRDGILGKMQRSIDELSSAVLDSGKKMGSSRMPAPTRDGEEPVPVEIVEKSSPLSYLPGMVGSLLAALATGGAVIILVFFILISREDMRNRLIRLIGQKQLNVTTQAMHDAGKRVSRYLLMQLIVNASYGLVLAIGLYFIGLPNAILWGVLAAVLRYIPYIGAWIAALLPLLLSLAVFDGWTEPLLTIALFLVLELISNNVMEPMLYGSSTGISTVGILLAAVFWTWLWGSVGLVLSTPLTVCIAVMGRYVPSLQFLDILLSDEPVLSPDAQYYQRLLAEDEIEANSLLTHAIEAKPLDEVYDEILLPALTLIERDAHRGDLSEERQTYLHETIREAIDYLAEESDRKPKEPVPEADATTPGAPSRCVMCLPARDVADELAGLMLAEVLERRGFCVQNISAKSLVSEMIEKVSEDSVNVVVVSAVPPFSVSHARYLCKRLRSQSSSNVKIVVGLWHTKDFVTKAQDGLKTYADRVCSTLHDALEQI